MFRRSPGWGKDYPNLQILTIADLLGGEEAKMPPPMTTFKQTGKADKGKPVQESLL